MTKWMNHLIDFVLKLLFCFTILKTSLPSLSICKQPLRRLRSIFSRYSGLSFSTGTGISVIPFKSHRYIIIIDIGLFSFPFNEHKQQVYLKAFMFTSLKTCIYYDFCVKSLKGPYSEFGNQSLFSLVVSSFSIIFSDTVSCSPRELSHRFFGIFSYLRLFII